jgi:hypothetical protein
MKTPPWPVAIPPVGHDAFLAEHHAAGKVVAGALAYC